MLSSSALSVEPQGQHTNNSNDYASAQLGLNKSQQEQADRNFHQTDSYHINYGMIELPMEQCLKFRWADILNMSSNPTLGFIDEANQNANRTCLIHDVSTYFPERK